MKAVCAFCGYRNSATAANCSQCGGSLAKAAREGFRLPWASWVPAIPVAALLWFHHAEVRSSIAKQRTEAETAAGRVQLEQLAKIKQLEKNFDRDQAVEEAKHRAWLKDERIISGRQAAEQHVTEWSRRQGHDPEFASTLLEKTLVDLERVGKDPAVAGESALRRVTEMVAPPGSRIEVTPKGDRFVVRVAFRLSAVTPHEAGAATALRSNADMRKAIEESTARLIRDIFDFCGARGLERLSVSCNRAIGSGEGENSLLQMRSLYRASVDAETAARVANWRGLSLAQVMKIMKVEHDLTSQITVRQNAGPAVAVDPNQPLEF